MSEPDPGPTVNQSPTANQGPTANQSPSSNPRSGIVLAVDLGLRSGLACFDAAGRLLWYRSTNFGTRARLKQGVGSVLNEAFPDGAPGGHLVMEGGGDLAPPWIREAERRGIRVTQIHAHTWRQDLLLERDQQSGKQAKLTADTLARRVIEESGAKRPTSLRHDAAEAILIGLWAVRSRGFPV